MSQFGVEEACKVTVEPCVAVDKFAAETKARHESVLFELEYGAERALEEDAFDGSKCNHLFGKAGAGGVAPFEGPIGFALDTWYCFDGMEQVQFLCWVLDVGVDDEGVCFAVDNFQNNLEAVEASSFGCHHFGGKIAAQILVDNAIGGSKECKNMGDKVAFIGRWRVQSTMSAMRQSLLLSRRMLQLSCTSARCQHGVWERA